MVAGVVEEAPDFATGVVAPAAGVFFPAVEVPAEVPSAGFADIPDAGVPGTVFVPAGFFAVGVVVVAASAGFVVGFATDGLGEFSVVAGFAPAGFASAGLSGTDGKRCARISEARM